MSTPMLKEEKSETEPEGTTHQNAEEKGCLEPEAEGRRNGIIEPSGSNKSTEHLPRAQLPGDRQRGTFCTQPKNSRRMSAPTVEDWGKLVRLGRCLKGRPRVVLWYKYQEEPGANDAYSETEWAGCRRTRRSTTGGLIRIGGHLLKTWCKTQATVALSSAEAELYGIERASAEALGTASMFKDFGRTERPGWGTPAQRWR